jgi:hypothetical protein
MKDVYHYIGSAIEQNNVSANQHVCAIRRWWREPPLEIFGTGLKAFLESGREGAALYKLSFQPRRQPVFLGKPRRKTTLVVVVPSTHNLAVMILIKLFALVVIISMLAVTLSLAFSVTLGKSAVAGEHKDC